jgi:pre-mRNA-splicing factor ISY1
MARPEEKAQAMLNKWVKMREQGDNYAEIQAAQRRPHLASLCEHLHDAEKWRRQIIREISTGISKIQNKGLGEHAIRDLNDEINKKIREKWHWNRRIVSLGGVDYNRIERLQQVEENEETEGGSIGLKGSSGYRYFGAAKDLPGVKELFARNAVKLTKRKRGDVYKYITPDYYGLRDEEDGVLLELEERASQERREKLQKLRNKFRTINNGKEHLFESDDEDCDEQQLGGILGAKDAIAAHVAIPTQEIVEKAMLEQKKRELLDSLF